jgi:hypothetical protein
MTLVWKEVRRQLTDEVIEAAVQDRHYRYTVNLYWTYFIGFRAATNVVIDDLREFMVLDR